MGRARVFATLRLQRVSVAAPLDSIHFNSTPHSHSFTLIHRGRSSRAYASTRFLSPPPPLDAPLARAPRITARTMFRAANGSRALVPSSSSRARRHGVDRGVARAMSPSWFSQRRAPFTDAQTSSSSLEDELRAARRARGDVIALGVDYGARRVGLAVSNGGAAPRPLRTLTHSGTATTTSTVRAVLDVALEECCDRIVVGIPVPPGRAAKDRRGRGRGAVQMHAVCARFAGEVADACARSTNAETKALVVYTYDESRTSKEASERIATSGGSNENGALDSASAAILLERYFDGSYGEAKLVKAANG